MCCDQDKDEEEKKGNPFKRRTWARQPALGQAQGLGGWDGKPCLAVKVLLLSQQVSYLLRVSIFLSWRCWQPNSPLHGMMERCLWAIKLLGVETSHQSQWMGNFTGKTVKVLLLEYFNPPIWRAAFDGLPRNSLMGSCSTQKGLPLRDVSNSWESMELAASFVWFQSVSFLCSNDCLFISILFF